MKIEITKAKSPKGNITLYKLTNGTNSSAILSSLGAGIVSIVVPDTDGNMADVLIGYKTPADYIYDGPCAGKVPGRYANRIAKGAFEINGKQYKLTINNGPNALHGGPEGFQNQIWDSEQTENGVIFSYTSKDGEEGYPGELKVSAEYAWSEDNELTLTLKAKSDADTIVNLTNHAYFNLNGENSGSVLNHRLWLNSTKYLPTDSTLIPEGTVDDVTGTPMDFSKEKELGQDIKTDFAALNYGKGYDNCWVIDNWKKGVMAKVAKLTNERRTRTLEVYTTQPAVQVYTGNWLGGSPESKSGRSYNDYDGVAIECQGMPDAPNKPNFPSQLLKVNEEYKQEIKFVFKTK